MNEDGDEEPRRPSALRQMFMAECLFSDAGESRFGMNVYQFYLYQIGIYNFDLNGKFTSQTEKDERNRQTKKKQTRMVKHTINTNMNLVFWAFELYHNAMATIATNTMQALKLDINISIDWEILEIDILRGEMFEGVTRSTDRSNRLYVCVKSYTDWNEVVLTLNMLNVKTMVAIISRVLHPILLCVCVIFCWSIIKN